jgi:hypothetical protein
MKQLITTFFLFFCFLGITQSAFAHLLSITPTTPFPASVIASSTTTATFTITNISKIRISAVDQSQLSNGLSISSNTCGSPMAPGAACIITLQLKAPSVATTVAGSLREWAKPSADGVQFPISVKVSQSTSQFTITPSTGAGGSISPSSPVTVNSGGSVSFTATPLSGFSIFQWLVDGVLAQTGGASFTLSNVTANHTVVVSFSAPVLSIVGGGLLTPTSASLLVLNQDTGNSQSAWTRQQTFTDGNGNPVANPTGFYLRGACTGTSICIAGATRSSGTAPGFIAVTNDGGNNWIIPTLSGLVNGSRINGVAATGEGTNARLVAAGQGAANIYTASSDQGVTWYPIQSSGSGRFYAASCTGSGSTATCALTGSGGGPVPTLIWSRAGAAQGSFTNETAVFSPLSGELFSVSCMGSDATSYCVAVGGGGSSGPIIALGQSTGSSGMTWVADKATPLGLSAGTSISNVSCSSNNVCVAIGSSSGSPVVVSSTNSGNTWSITTIPGLPSGQLNSVSCKENICVIVGGASSTLPIIAVGVITNGSISWSVVNQISGAAPLTGSFLSVSCGSNGNSKVCTAAGTGATSQTPAIAVSTDSGSTWTYKANPTVAGNYNATGASSL